MESVIIWSAACKPLPDRPYVKRLLLFGIRTSTGQNIILDVTNFQPTVDLLPKEQVNEVLVESGVRSFNETQLQAKLEKCPNFSQQDYQFITGAEIIERTPGYSFTNNRVDKLLRITVHGEYEKSSLQHIIQETKMLGDIPILDVIHRSVPTYRQVLMYPRKMRFQTYHLALLTFPNTSPDLAVIPVYECNAMFQHICTDEEKKDLLVDLRSISIRLSAFNSKATRAAYQIPDASHIDDRILYLAYKVEDLEPEVLCLEDFFNGEGRLPIDLLTAECELLNRFYVILHQESQVQVVVYGSDDTMVPASTMEYISMRAEMLRGRSLRCFFSFSPITGYAHEIHEKRNGKTDLIHPGMERVDVCQLVKKMNVKPEMEGFSLLDIVRHVKLLTDKPFFSRHKSTRFVKPTRFDDQYESDIKDILRSEVHILWNAVNETGFLATQVSNSRAYDLELTQVIEAGETQRIFGSIMRTFYDENLYYNELDQKRSWLIDNRDNKDSSFPDPEWLPNPDVTSFRKEQQKTQKEIKDDFCMRPSVTLKKRVLSQVYNNDSEEECVKKIKNEESEEEEEEEKEEEKEEESYQGGLVLDPTAGFYYDPGQLVVTLDWKSMYPNIILKHNICVMGLILDKKWYDDPRATKVWIPYKKGRSDVFVTHYDGKPIRTFIPSIVRGFLAARERERELGALATHPRQKMNHKMAELSAKVSSVTSFVFLCVFFKYFVRMRCMAILVPWLLKCPAKPLQDVLPQLAGTWH
jgi:DNA polymerase family B